MIINLLLKTLIKIYKKSFKHFKRLKKLYHIYYIYIKWLILVMIQNLKIEIITHTRQIMQMIFVLLVMIVINGIITHL
jgi:hypothetical protein